MWHRVVRLLEQLGPPPSNGRMVEVGCGGGILVRAAIEIGWEVWGTEISESSADLLRPLMRDRLHVGSVLDAPFAAASFDGAVMIEVLEHLDEPARYVAALARLLKPGGRLLLTTPNGKGSAARVLGMGWKAFGDEHLCCFDASSLIRLLERHGFEDIRVATTSLSLAVSALGWVRRLRRPVATSAPIAERPKAPVTPIVLGPMPPVGLGSRAADLGIEVMNFFANTARMGDSLKVTARRR
jgi:SAM-dependent methyltransferase